MEDHMRRYFAFNLTAVGLLILSACTFRATSNEITDTTQNTTISTSGRSWFTNDGLVRQGERINAFAALNFENLTTDMALGGGEYLTSLGTLMGVPDDQRASFFHLAQGQYTTLVHSGAATPANLLSGLDRTLAEHGIMTATAR
jgi:hypothetical protein